MSAHCCTHVCTLLHACLYTAARMSAHCCTHVCTLQHACLHTAARMSAHCCTHVCALLHACLCTACVQHECIILGYGHSYWIAIARPPCGRICRVVKEFAHKWLSPRHTHTHLSMGSVLCQILCAKTTSSPFLYRS